MFTAALFTIARTRKQPRCSSTDEWIKKLRYNGILLNHKRNIFESILMRWTKLEPIIQTEVSQKEKYKYYILTYIYMESEEIALVNLFSGQQWTKT